MMKRRGKYFLSVIFLIVLAGLAGYWYAFMRTPRSMLNLKPAYKVDAAVLLHEYTEDEAVAGKKYSGKVVEVMGKVIRVGTGEGQLFVVLEDDFSGVIAYLDSSFVGSEPELIRLLKPDQGITIRGQCDGMLNDVVISRAVVIQ